MEAEKKDKIFISYGHDFRVEAEMFAKTLTDAGFDVWIDYEGITPGTDWRERITEAIISCDYFVALLSRYGLREGGVCLDELAIAVSRNRTNIRPVAVERGVEALVPTSVAAIQFFDMSAWRDVAPECFDGWYAEKMHDFLEDCLLRPAQYEKRLNSIKSRLRFPEAFSREKFDVGKEFRKRAWLDEKINAWLDDTVRNICLLEGFPGFGKSCYCSAYFHYNPRTCGLVYCDKYKDKSDGVYKLIREVSFAFAVRIPSFAARLDALLNDPAASAEFTSPEEAFDFFIAEPLHVIDGNIEDALVVIDGVDFFYKNGENVVLDVFCDRAQKLPHFAKFLLTARQTALRTGAAGEVYKITATPEDVAVFEDIKGYLRDTFGEVVETDEEADAISTTVAKRAQGSFLYASAVRDGIRNGSMSVSDAQALPCKVADVYFTWMKQLVSPRDYGGKYADVLSILVALENPPIDLIKNALGMRRAELYDILRTLSVLLVKNTDKFGNACVSFYCDSFAEWIRDESAAGVYAVFAEDGFTAVADYLADAEEDEELTDYDYVKAVAVLRGVGKKRRLAAFASSEKFTDGSLQLARKLQGNPDFYGEWNEILDGLLYLAGVSEDADGLLARVACCRARGEFVCGNPVGCGRILAENKAIIEANADERTLLDYLYMLGTVADYAGKRDESLSAFHTLLQKSEGKHPDYYVKALAGLIWNDHFNDLANGLKNLSLIRTDECDADIAVQAELISARMLLSAGRMSEALEKFGGVLDSDSESLWKHDIVARKNQMLAIESIVAAYDGGDYARAIRYGEAIYEKLRGVGGIPECYCLSWTSLAYNKSGNTQKADELLSLAETTYGESCGDSLWLKTHLKSIRAKYARRDGRTQESIDLYREVAALSAESGDAWVRGDACFDIITTGFLADLDTDPDGTYRNALFTLADTTALPHLRYKAEVVRFLDLPVKAATERRHDYDEIPALPSVSAANIRALVHKKTGGVDAPCGTPESQGE